mmetsp:Transcript_71079/g.133900  ORF Transcript_71079/g.133900 Transcript_71079/m.133900 type:complete len:484 (+) Transcript_71079:342-1793(+)
MAVISSWMLQRVQVAALLLVCSTAYSTNSSGHLAEKAQRSFWTLQQPNTAMDVTLTVQTSEDREWLLPKLCDRWPGPMSIVLFLAGDRISPDELKNREAGVVESCTQPASGPNVLTMKSGTPRYLSQHQHRIGKVHVQVAQVERDAEYPVNLLRNRAIEAVTTSHFLSIDVDFMPSRELYHDLVSLGRSSPEVFRTATQALVVPAFRMTSVIKECMMISDGDPPKCAHDFLIRTPRTFGELLICVTRNLCRPFDFIYNPFGHSTTDYPTFFKQDGVRPINCFDSNKYEPYLVLSKEGGQVPKYDESFTGYGKNKIELVLWLRANGFTFSVLPKAFLVHLPHPKSKAKRQWNDGKKDENAKLLAMARSKLQEQSRMKAEGEMTYLCARSERAMAKYNDVWLKSVKAANASLQLFTSNLNSLSLIAKSDLVSHGVFEERTEDGVKTFGKRARHQLVGMQKYAHVLDSKDSKVHIPAGCKRRSRCN